MTEFPDINLYHQHHHLIINGAAPVLHAVVVLRHTAATAIAIVVEWAAKAIISRRQ